MIDVSVQREAREVIADALWDVDDPAALEMADVALAALADAGISVGRYEAAGQLRSGRLYPGTWPPEWTDGEPVYRRVEGGATGERDE